MMHGSDYYAEQADRALELLTSVMAGERPMGTLIPSLREDAHLIAALATAAHTYAYVAETVGAERLMEPLTTLFQRVAEEEGAQDDYRSPALDRPYVLAYNDEFSWFIGVRGDAPQTLYGGRGGLVEGIETKALYSSRTEIDTVLDLANAKYWYRRMWVADEAETRVLPISEESAVALEAEAHLPKRSPGAMGPRGERGDKGYVW